MEDLYRTFELTKINVMILLSLNAAAKFILTLLLAIFGYIPFDQVEPVIKQKELPTEDSTNKLVLSQEISPANDEAFVYADSLYFNPEHENTRQQIEHVWICGDTETIDLIQIQDEDILILEEIGTCLPDIIVIDEEHLIERNFFVVVRLNEGQIKASQNQQILNISCQSSN